MNVELSHNSRSETDLRYLRSQRRSVPALSEPRPVQFKYRRQVRNVLINILREFVGVISIEVMQFCRTERRGQTPLPITQVAHFQMTDKKNFGQRAVYLDRVRPLLFPQPGKNERRIVFHADRVRNFAAGNFLPFEKPSAGIKHRRFLNA